MGVKGRHQVVPDQIWDLMTPLDACGVISSFTAKPQ